VALTVSGMGLLTILGALKIANDAAGRLRDEEAAQLLAEEHMTQLLAEPLKTMGPRQGEEGKFSWEESVQPGRHPNIAEIVTSVRWKHHGRPMEFVLVSLREISPLGGGE
jgi:hypothetical protein